MTRYSSIFEEHLDRLTLGYSLTVSLNDDWLIVHDFKLPPGYNARTTDILVCIPSDYPVSPPGIAARVYVSPRLRFHGRKLDDVHEDVTPGWGDWAWFCFEHINWDMHRDDLVTFLEIIRLHLTNPQTL